MPECTYTSNIRIEASIQDEHHYLTIGDKQYASKQVTVKVYDEEDEFNNPLESETVTLDELVYCYIVSQCKNGLPPSK